MYLIFDIQLYMLYFVYLLFENCKKINIFIFHLICFFYQKTINCLIIYLTTHFLHLFIFQTPISAPEYSIQSINVKNIKSSGKNQSLN